MDKSVKGRLVWPMISRINLKFWKADARQGWPSHKFDNIMSPNQQPRWKKFTTSSSRVMGFITTILNLMFIFVSQG